jgi:eukaryotic-like serine/threonine-protein kinase
VDLKTHEQRWQFNANRVVLWYAAAENDTIYFTASDMMFAVDAQSGQEKWRLSFRADWMPHAVENGVIYAGDRAHRFYAIDALTGKEIWSFKERTMDRNEWSASAVSSGRVLLEPDCTQ